MFLSMSWVRSNRRVGSWIALFAITLQLALSFGHLHLEGVGLVPSAAASAQANGSADDGPLPVGRHGHDLCAICATLGLLSTSALPAVSSLVLPVEAARVWVADLRSTPLPFALHFIFQARAPPAIS
jgi:hypothetical protein